MATLLRGKNGPSNDASRNQNGHQFKLVGGTENAQKPNCLKLDEVDQFFHESWLFVLVY
jgi:hypothetical protein